MKSPRQPPRGQATAAAKLLREFHSRDARRLWYVGWDPPEEMWAIGTAKTLYYSSDKADPGDPNDSGGEWKGYYHEHDPGTLVYLTPEVAERMLEGDEPVAVLRPRWPDIVTWLGSADGYDVEMRGRVRQIRLGGRKGVGLQLFAFPNRRTLVAMCDRGGREKDTVLWHGPRLTVTHAGVEG